MIRFPERFHASVTPGAHLIGVEPNYLEDPPRATPRVNHVSSSTQSGNIRRPVFDFSALAAVLGG